MDKQCYKYVTRHGDIPGLRNGGVDTRGSWSDASRIGGNDRMAGVGCKPRDQVHQYMVTGIPIRLMSEYFYWNSSA